MISSLITRGTIFALAFGAAVSLGWGQGLDGDVLRASAAGAPTSTVSQPRPAITLEMRGDIYMARKQYRDAIDVFRQCPTSAVVENKIGIAFLHLREARASGEYRPSEQPPLSPVIRQHYKGVLILNGDYTPAEAEATVAAGKADAIAFGRLFISNPDLVERIRTGAPLATAEMAT